MDQFVPGDAASAPAAAQGTVGSEPQVTPGQDGSAPSAPAAAEAPPRQSQPPVDTTDYRAIVQQMAPRVQQYEQAFGELRQMVAAAQQQQQEQAAQTAAQARLDSIYRLAETMPPEDAIKFIRQSEDTERANYHRQINEIRQQAQMQVYQTAATFAAPMYADHLGQQHQLPAEYVQRLRMLPPQQMDAYVPVLQAEYAKDLARQRDHQALLAQLDQLQRSQQADAMATSGAHTGGDTGVPTGTSGAAAVQDGSTTGLLKVPGMGDFLRGLGFS